MEWDLITEEIDLHPLGLRQGKGKPRKPDYEIGTIVLSHPCPMLL
jgi:hypothetical protein